MLFFFFNDLYCYCHWFVFLNNAQLHLLIHVVTAIIFLTIWLLKQVLHYSCFEKDLDDFVEAALLYYGKQNMLDNTPISLSLEKDNDPRLLTSPLKFPGKLAVDVLNNRLFISDSNHNRIVSPLWLPIPNSPLHDHLCIILVMSQ